MKNLNTFLFKLWTFTSSFIVSLSVASIFLFIIYESQLFLSTAPWSQVFFSSDWFPSENKYGMLSLLIGTLLVVLGGVLITIAIAWPAAIAIIFYLPSRVQSSAKLLIETASGTPSIVIGLFGLVTLVPWLSQKFSPGFGLLSASLVLSFLLVPTLILNTIELLSLDLDEVLHVARSLKISKSNIIRKIIWPSKKNVMFRSVFLIFGRGIGETMAILMVAGNVIQIPMGLFEPFRTLNSTIALEMPYAMGIHRSSLFFLGLVTLCLVIVTRFLFFNRRSQL